MTFTRLVIISCCALGGFVLGRLLSPLASARTAADQRPANSQVTTPVTPVELPPPERAGRAPFVDVYRSLRSASTKERVTYLRILQELPEGPDRRAALTAFFQCMASINPQEAADVALKVGENDIQRAVVAVLGATAASHTPVLVKMLLDLPAGVNPKWREQKLKGQMFYWAAFDPTAAVQFADQYQAIYPDLAAQGIVQCLAAADPAAAERWLKEHPDLSKQPDIISNYLQGLYQNDPAKARRYLIEHAADEAAQPSLRGAARLTFLRSADEAVAFINDLPTTEARRTALSGILDTNAELFANGETSTTALCEGVAEWVTKFSPNDWPPTMSRFLEKWRELDPDGSVNWMSKLPSPTRSAIAREFVRDLRADRLKQVLARTAGDFHHDVLTAVAENLSQTPAHRRKEVIEALELRPEDAAQLAAIHTDETLKQK